MTLKDLSQLSYLKLEMEEEKRRLAELTAAATACTATLTGLPPSTKIADKTALATEIADIKSALLEKSKKVAEEYSNLTRFIASVDDSLTRLVLSLRFLDGLLWSEVAARIPGNSEDSVKKICYRYLKKSNNCPLCHEHMCDNRSSGIG